MKKSFLAFVLALTIAAGAFAAPRAGDLTAAPVGDTTWVGFGIRDVNALLNAPADSLLGRALSMAPMPETVGVLGAFDGRVTMTPDYSKIEKVFVAFELKSELKSEALESFGIDAKASDFNVAPPAGAVVTPLGVVDDIDNIGRLYVALLERDGAKYMIMANGNPEQLAAMAAASEGNPAAVAHTNANIWIQGHLPKAMFENVDVEMPADFDLEFGIADTPASVKVQLWCNYVEQLNAVVGKDLRTVLTGGAPAAPLLFGKAPLAALYNLSASFLPENFRMADVLGEDGPEAEQEMVSALADIGFDWNDLVKILRGNITVGFAGKLNAPMVGEIPGVFVNVSGIDVAKAKGLVDLAAAQLGGMLGAPAGYNADGWAGYQFGGMVPGLLATGEKGLLVAAMNADQMGVLSAVEPGLASAVEPRNHALALNTKELQPVLKKLFDMFGDDLLEMAGEAVKSKKDTIAMVIDNMTMLDALSIVNEGAETLVIEVTPNAGLVNMFLPAPKAAEQKPAA